jgi:uncharacterized protein YcbX
VTPLGIDGDRVILVVNSQGRVVTARSHPALLGHKGTTDPENTPLVDGRPWTDSSVLADIRNIAGAGAGLVEDRTTDRFDVLPLLVATDGAIAAFGKDGRRLRPNLVIGGVDGLDERAWPGRHLRIAGVTIRVDSLRGRCVMTTYNPDTTSHDPAVLRDIVARFAGKLALNCAVECAGVIERNQKVELL